MSIKYFEYCHDKNNNIISAIMPLNKIIEKSNINNISNELIGGTLEINSTHKCFDGLGVPVGLVIGKKERELVFPKKEKIKEIECKVMSEDNYDKLFNKIVKKREKRERARKTEKSRKTVLRGSKKIHVKV